MKYTIVDFGESTVYFIKSAAFAQMRNLGEGESSRDSMERETSGAGSLSVPGVISTWEDQ